MIYPTHLSVSLLQKLPHRALCCLETPLNKVRDRREVKRDWHLSFHQSSTEAAACFLSWVRIRWVCTLICLLIISYTSLFLAVLSRATSYLSILCFFSKVSHVFILRQRTSPKYNLRTYFLCHTYSMLQHLYSDTSSFFFCTVKNQTSSEWIHWTVWGVCGSWNVSPLKTWNIWFTVDQKHGFQGNVKVWLRWGG